MSYIDSVSDKIAAILVKEGLDYNQTKNVFKAARQKANLKPSKQKGGAVERLSLEDELKFIDQAYQESGRTGLMMQTLLETGCRASEFIELRIEDISFAERLITINKGKGDKRREVPIRQELAERLKIHIGERKAGPLFRSRQKPYKYSRQRIGQIVRGVAKKAGIFKKVYPHLLRHTVATKLLNLGMGIAEVQRFLGHENISTTQIYAVMDSATLRKRFDEVTTPTARRLIQIEDKNDVGFASDLL